MWKFIRRLFILLVLLIIAFLVYRYVNPDGASRLVDRIKLMPDTISSYFGPNQDDDIKIDSTTTEISWDINLLEDDEELTDDTWLEELNKEIESILWMDDEDEIEIKDTVEASGSIVVETVPVVEEPESNVQPVVDTTPVVTPTVNPVTPTQANDGLSDYDYDQIDNVFGNLVE